MKDTATNQAHSTRTAGLRPRFLRFISHGSRLGRRPRFALYAAVTALLLVSVWFPVALYLSYKADSYVSTWELILPGAGAGHAVSLDSLGQASATINSPYTSHAVDPKVNYKAVAESMPVLGAAAAQMGMSTAEFGKPRIKLTDQTAMMHFRVSGETPEQAHAKSKALYGALQQQLDRLRNDETSRREATVGRILNGFSEKLRRAQQQLLEHQAGAQVVSQEQFIELTLNLERMRSKVRDLRAQHAGLEGQIGSLQAALETSPRLAAAVLDLQHDALFRKLAAEWAQASALLTRNRARWGRKHQEVISASEDEKEFRKALLTRARIVVPDNEINTDRLVVHGTSQAALYMQLVESFVAKQGMDAQIAALDRSIDEQKRTLERSTADASKLEDLKRKHQVATAVFTTALAKVDIGKSDRFSSYPLVQLLAEPSLPEKPETLGRDLALLGGATGSLLSLIGIVLLWIRKPYLQRMLKSV